MVSAQLKAENRYDNLSLNRSSVSISYNAEADTYSVGYGGKVDTFGDANSTDKDPGASTWVINYQKHLDFFKRNPDGSTARLSVVFAPQTRLMANTNVLLAIAQRRSASGEWTGTAFPFGWLTQADNIPRTGSADYRLRMSGFFSGFRHSGQISPEASMFHAYGDMTMLFGEGRYTFTTGMSLNSLDAEYYGTVGGITGEGTIAGSGNSFGGPMNFSILGHDYRGQLDGAFYGPAGREVGGTVEGSGDGLFFSGGFVGTNL